RKVPTVAVADVSARHPQAGNQAPEQPALSVGMMGMYIFLASEVMFFGSLFATYFYLYGSHTGGWPAAGTQPVNWFPLPWVNTFILVTSGVTCHFAAEAMARDNRRRFFLLLASTLVLGAFFEVGQGYEFLTAKINFTDINQFGTAFFTMTG